MNAKCSSRFPQPILHLVNVPSPFALMASASSSGIISSLYDSAPFDRGSLAAIPRPKQLVEIFAGERCLVTPRELSLDSQEQAM